MHHSHYLSTDRVLQARNHAGDALEIWKLLEVAQPDQAEIPRSIAGILMSQKRYAEAIAELESADKRKLLDSGAMMILGEAYMSSGNKQAASATIEKAAGMSSDSLVLNDAAFALADANVNLEKALLYAQDAVKQIETDTAKITIDDLTLDEARAMPKLAAYWDTIGWVQFRANHLDVAEKYLMAAWKLRQSAASADHLGQLYDKSGRNREAADFYSLALDTGKASQDTTDRYMRLTRKTAGNRGNPEDLLSYRTVKIPGPFKEAASAEFMILFSPGAEPVVKALGDASVRMPDGTELLGRAKFDISFPDDGPSRILRRGILSCSQLMKTCEFVMYPVEEVNSVR
jgi:tetratricopeptide (TPR) repeat protein